MSKSYSKQGHPAQGRGGSFISDPGSARNFMTDVKGKAPEGSRFDLSKDVKTTFDMGFLIPILAQETLPRDKFTVGSEIFARFQALASPAMHRFDLTTETFYVPYRILWDGWEKSIMSVHDGSVPPAIPYFQEMPVAVGSLADYFGYPLKTISKTNCWAFAAYNYIWNEYYRNPAIDAELPYKLVDGLNAFTGTFDTLQKKRWNSDYFTRSLPSAQAGAPVSLPLGTRANVNYDPNSVNNARFSTSNGSTSSGSHVVSADFGFASPNADVIGDGKYLDFNPNGTLYADLTTATAANVSDIRLAFRLQEWAERAMRFIGGSKGKYVDFMKGFFNSNVPDATIQRPIYLGGTAQPMVINGVTQTSETSTTPLGDLAGQGVSIGNGKAFSYSCDEHGIIISLMCCRPKTSYLDGLPKMFSKFDPIEFGHFDFVHLSEQPVLNQEVFYDTADGQNLQTFGYQPIYSDYRYNNSSVHGQFRTTMSYWTEARKFATRPHLNTSFVECSPANRIFAVQGAPMASQLQCQIFFHISAYRQLPFYGTPMT